MQIVDYIALAVFGFLWFGYSYVVERTRLFNRKSLTEVMSERRRRWIYNSLNRDLKMIDTQIMSGLQNGTAFFASASMFAIGSCFALIGATDKIDAVFRDLPFAFHGGRAAFELKVGGLTALFGYAFFKFGWSYRLFNYCTILFGGLPMLSQINDRAEAEHAADQVVKMNIIAAKNFNEGLRAIFLSIGYLGWFVNAYIFMAMTLLVVVILTRRQFFSDARLAISDPNLP